MPPQARREFSSKIAASAFFLITAVIVGLTTTDFAAGVGDLAIPFGFLCACALVLFRARRSHHLVSSAHCGFRCLR
jgi:hypothetical protein